ncbi:hypothetical protein CKO50_23330 [Pseudoalteromonas sp. HM-SA03]|uniref:hypothetical protein n=1 Tax=Pseudoalteromonas sp. HM-SA03 TaxID=2029678 RepID=UPI000BAE6475|nr:hypothetical protein [Pseudoalteromonas sp. HM-SA03]PAX99005.1 hypothetical protein CKO50_23330 [Pseudoalteromonas sp. HM-SA03]
MEQNLFSLTNKNNHIKYTIFGSGIGMGYILAQLLLFGVIGIVIGLISGYDSLPIVFGIYLSLLGIVIACFIGAIKSTEQSVSIKNDLLLVHKGSDDKEIPLNQIQSIEIENKLLSSPIIDSYKAGTNRQPSPLWLALGKGGAAIYASDALNKITSTFGADVRRMRLKSRLKKEYSIICVINGKSECLFKNLKESTVFALYYSLAQTIIDKKTPVFHNQSDAISGRTAHRAFKWCSTLGLFLWILLPVAIYQYDQKFVPKDNWKYDNKAVITSIQENVYILQANRISSRRAEELGLRENRLPEQDNIKVLDFRGRLKKDTLYYPDISKHNMLQKLPAIASDSRSEGVYYVFSPGYQSKMVQFELKYGIGLDKYKDYQKLKKLNIQLEPIVGKAKTGRLFISGSYENVEFKNKELKYKPWMELSTGSYQISVTVGTITDTFMFDIHAKTDALYYVGLQSTLWGIGPKKIVFEDVYKLASQ